MRGPLPSYDAESDRAGCDKEPQRVPAGKLQAPTGALAGRVSMMDVSLRMYMRPQASAQCDISTGTVIVESSTRVAPPKTRSRQRR